jgi:hypothetical protein
MESLMSWRNGIPFFAGALLIAAALLASNRQPVQGQGRAGEGAAKHTVVATDGAHLIVTDNAADKLYFYTIDKDAKIGDDLKLRGTIDLRDVGQASLKPINAAPQK